ncbi:hypothetical protein ACQR1F_08965 [Bradyrhizobium sp. HKCCYLS3013]
MDTSIATPAPVKLAKAEQPAAEVAKPSARDAFAQMSAVETNPQVAAVKSAEKPRATRIADTGKPAAEAKKRRTAKAHPGRPMILVAQQPHVGSLDWTW